MTPRYIDAHNHLQDPRLSASLPSLLRSLPGIISNAVVNGTHESDWPSVSKLGRSHQWIIPSFGLHPWRVNERGPDWKNSLISHIDAAPTAAIGEIGLDRWIDGHDIQAQLECLHWQLAIAAQRDLPTTIHCIQAWGALNDALRSGPRPSRGFLIHAYGGPAEMILPFVKLGAYFSFSPSFLHNRKASQREAFRRIPADRLLVETDAPDLAPPPEHNLHPLQSPDHQPINHPANIEVAYRALAKVRGIPLDELIELVASNFSRLFSA